MKKFVTLIAALALCFALCISASAYNASEVLNTSNASTGTAEVTFGSQTVTAEVYPAGTTFAAGKDVPGKYFSEFQVYGPNNSYVGYYFSSPAFILPDDGNTYELQVFDGSSFTYENVYVTSAAAAAEPDTPAEPTSPVSVNGSTVVADLLYDGTLTVEGTVTEDFSFSYVDAMWGMEDTCTGYLVEIKAGSTITASAGSLLIIPCHRDDDGSYYAPGSQDLLYTGSADDAFAYTEVMLYRIPDGSGKYLILTLEGTLDQAATAPVESFTDITKEDAFYDAIAYATEKGLMSGVSETAFERKNPVSHKEIFGSLELAGTNVDAAKAWAAEQNLADAAAATREDVITMLWIANGKQAADETVLAKFADTATISAESKTAMAWAVETGLIKGYSNGHLGAQVQLTRGAMAAILYRAAV